MKKYIFIILFICLSITFGWVKYDIHKSKYKDITYCAEQYVTKGFFNKYKLCRIDKINLTFCDEKLGVIIIDGTKDTPPHNIVTYKLFLEKDKKGIWSVKKFYPNP